MTNDTVKRHCMIVHAYYPLGETRVEREAMALMERGYEVDVLCLRDDDESPTEMVDGVQIYRLPVKRHRGRGLVVQLFEYLAFFMLVVLRLFSLQGRRGYGTVQCHNLPDFLIFAAFWPRLRGAQLILDLHDLMPDFYAARFGNRMDSWPVKLVLLQEKLSCRFAHQVITVTELWRQTLIQRGVPAAKIAVVMNVAHDQLFVPGQIQAETSVNGSFNVIYHGTITHRYGVDLAVQAIDRLRADDVDVHLTILGDGDYRDDIVEMVERLGLGESVHLSQGFLPTNELPSLISRADVGIVPNRDDLFTDALLPTKLLEYVALGVPVIAARTSGISGYFNDTEVEFFSPGNSDELADCIRHLYNDSTRRKELVQNTSEFNRHYSWARVAEEYGDLVERLGRHSALRNSDAQREPITEQSRPMR